MLKQKYSQGTNNPEIKISWIAGEKSELENRDRKTSSQQNGGHISDSLFLLFPFFFIYVVVFLLPVFSTPFFPPLQEKHRKRTISSWC